MQSLIRKPFNWLEFHESDKNYLCTVDGTPVTNTHTLTINETLYITGIIAIGGSNIQLRWDWEGHVMDNPNPELNLTMFIWGDLNSMAAELLEITERIRGDKELLCLSNVVCKVKQELLDWDRRNKGA